MCTFASDYCLLCAGVRVLIIHMCCNNFCFVYLYCSPKWIFPLSINQTEKMHKKINKNRWKLNKTNSNRWFIKFRNLNEKKNGYNKTNNLLIEIVNNLLEKIALIAKTKRKPSWVNVKKVIKLTRINGITEKFGQPMWKKDTHSQAHQQRNRNPPDWITWFECDMKLKERTRTTSTHAHVRSSESE